MPWNFNDGWEADLDGRRVEPVRVDGWQQAWIVPEGAGGTLTMRFAPQGTYTAVLVAGLVVSGLLLLAALVLLLRASVRGAGARRPPTADLAVVADGVRGPRTAPWSSSPWPRGRVDGMGGRRGLRRRQPLAAPRPRRASSLLAVVLVVASGVLDAWPLPVPGSVADGLAVGGLGLVLALALRGLAPARSNAPRGGVVSAADVRPGQPVARSRGAQRARRAGRHGRSGAGRCSTARTSTRTTTT